MKRTLTGLVALIALGGPAGTAQASQTPNADPADWLLTYPSGLEITYDEIGGVAMSLADMQLVNYDANWPGMSANAYWNNSFTTNPYSRPGVETPGQVSWYSQIWGGDMWFSQGTLSKPVCPVTATRGVEMRCERDTVKFTFNRPVTNPVLHLNNLGANAFSENAEWVDQLLWMHGDTILTLDLSASTYTGTPGLALQSAVGNLAVVTDGPAYHLPGGSPLTGAPAITRTADASVDTTGRPGGHYVGGSFGAGSVVVNGTWTEIVFNRDLLWSFNSFGPTTTPWRTVDPAKQARNECILDQLPSPTIFRCDLSGAIWTQNTSATISAGVYAGLQTANPIPEGTSFVITVDEDFGTAPASYDAGDGASHVVGDASIGSAVSSSGAELSVTNSAVSGVASPNGGATDHHDDAFGTPPMLPVSGDYTVTIPLAGVSSAAKLCGWIDADASSTFEATERVCQAVGPAATSASLTWPSASVSAIADPTWMRLRLSYDLSGVESPTGRLDSGEVEDWRLSPYSASAQPLPSGVAGLVTQPAIPTSPSSSLPTTTVPSPTTPPTSTTPTTVSPVASTAPTSPVLGGTPSQVRAGYPGTFTGGSGSGVGADDTPVWVGSDLAPSSIGVNVGGFVWFDQTADGRQHLAEVGFGGVEIQIETADGTPALDVDGNPVGPTTTDATGHFLFPRLQAGTYVVRLAGLPGYQPTLNGVGERLGDSSLGSAISLDMSKDGEFDLSLDFGFVSQQELPSTGLAPSTLWFMALVMLALGLSFLPHRCRQSA